jgi:uncharacterized membrane protein
VLDTINGLPVHPLVVHAVVVLVPLSVLLLLASLASATVRRRAGIVTPALATLALLLVPIATQSGEALQGRVGETDLIQAHAELGESLLPWMAGVAVVAWVLWWLSRSPREAGGSVAGRSGAVGKWFIPLAVVGLIASVGAGVQIVRIGDSGAKAVWQQTGQLAPAGEDGQSGGED